MYGFKMWSSLRKEETPLLTSRRVLPVTAALWNKSKNGSDVATGMIRGAWFPIPTGTVTPVALVIQRILYLMEINIMRISSLSVYNDEDIDSYRQRTNKMSGSFRGFLLKLREICITPNLNLIKKQKYTAACLVESSLPCGQSNSTSFNRVSVSPKQKAKSLRSNTNLKVYEIHDPCESVMNTGRTPSNKRCKLDEAAKRRKECKLPMQVSLSTEDGKPKTVLCDNPD